MNSFEPAFKLLFTIGLVVPLISHAQGTERPQPPSGALINHAPDYSQWVVNFTYPAPIDGPAPTPSSIQHKTKSITTTRTGSITHEEIIDGVGQTLDRWYLGPTLYVHDPASNAWMEAQAGQNDGGLSYTGLPANGFRGLDWIVSSNYVGVIQHSGHECLVFTQSPDAGSHGTSDASQYQHWETYALIDLTTRLPEEVKQLGGVGTYQFTELPHEPQELSPDLAKIIKQGQEMRARLSEMPPRPY